MELEELIFSLFLLFRNVFYLTACLIDETESLFPVGGKDRARLSSLWTIAAFLFIYAWNVGAALDTPSKQRFSTFYRQLAYGKCSYYYYRINNSLLNEHFPVKFL